MRRGEIRSLQSIRSQDQYALIIGADALNESETTGWVITAPIDTIGHSPDLLVAVTITSPINGVIRLDNITSVRKARVGDLIGRLAPDAMETINTAIGAALDL